MTPPPATVPYGYCYCGCGSKTNIPRYGKNKGVPFRYLKGHQCIGRKPSADTLTARRRSMTKHGASLYRHKSRLYSIWTSMKQRTINPNDKAYARYGGRGITVCSRWMDFTAFQSDMGDPSRGLSLERKDNDGPYSPDNCVWATPKRQSNNSRQNFLVDFRGETFTLQQLAEVSGMNRYTLRSRIVRGMTAEEAIRKPLILWGRHA